MAPSSADRAPLTGVLFAVLLVAAFTTGGAPPGTDDSLDKLVAYYADNESKMLISGTLFALSAVALLFFVGTLAAVLRGAATARSALPGVVRSGGSVAATGILIFAGLAFTLGDGGDNFEPAALQTLNALNADLFFPVVGGIAACMLAAGLSALRTGALPRWLAWSAVVIGIACLTPAGFFGFIGSALWSLVAGIVLASGRGQAAQSTA